MCYPVKSPTQPPRIDTQPSQPSKEPTIDKKQTHLKSATQIKATAARKVAAQLAITNRRTRVADLIAQHTTMRSIATILDVSLNTVILDKRAIDAELAELYSEEYQWRRERELEELDRMEFDIIAKIALAVDTEDEIKLYNMQLKIKSMRAKWLGYDNTSNLAKPGAFVAESGSNINIDQRQQTAQNITITMVDEAGEKQSKPFVELMGEALKPQIAKALPKPIQQTQST